MKCSSCGDAAAVEITITSIHDRDVSEKVWLCIQCVRDEYLPVNLEEYEDIHAEEEKAEEKA